jgi:hypothetical protein
MLSPLLHDLWIVNKSVHPANGCDDLYYLLKICPATIVSYQFSSSIYRRAHATSNLNKEWKPHDRFKWLILFYWVGIIQGWQEPLQVVVIKIWTQLLFLKEPTFGKPFYVVTTRLAKGKHITNLEPKVRGRMLYMIVHNPYRPIYRIVLVIFMT